MKKCLLITLLFISFIATKSFSQSYIPLPDSGGVWVNQVSYYWVDQSQWPFVTHFYHDEYVNYCSNGEETTINGETYFKVDTCGGGYKAALRNDNGKVYIVPANTSIEYLLYDMTAQAGDIITDVYQEFLNESGSTHDIEVYSNGIDSIFINGAWRKQIETSKGTWIEGLGNSTGLFRDGGENVSNFFQYLYCHSSLDTTLWPANSAGPGVCYQPVAKILSNEPLNFTIYPNPAADFLKVEISDGNKLEFISIADLQGRVIYEEIYEQTNSGEIDISFLKSGTYIIEVSSSTSTSRISFVKI